MEYFEGLKNIKVSEDSEIYKVTDESFRGPKTHVLVEGIYNGRHFAITRHTLGFPDAYIELKPYDYIMKAECEDGMPRYDLYEGRVHGGATFFGRCYWHEDDDRFYLGWDYGHCGDFDATSAGWPTKNEAKKWTLLEVMMSIAQAEADLRWQNEQHWEELHALPEERDGT